MDFNKQEKANELTDLYFNEVKSKGKFSKEYIINNVEIESLRLNLLDRFFELEDETDYHELFITIGKGDGWNSNELEKLAKIPYEKLFKIIHENPDFDHFRAIKFFLKQRSDSLDDF